jgi:hypothetical protein
MPNRSLRLFASSSVKNQGESGDFRTASPQHSASQHRRERELDRICGVNQPKSVAIPLATMVPLLMEASENNRVWLQDFQDETVRIDSDLYEVLMACQELQTSKAA